MLLRPALRTPPGSDQPLLFPRVVFRHGAGTEPLRFPGKSAGIRWNLWEDFHGFPRISWESYGISWVSWILMEIEHRM